MGDMKDGGIGIWEMRKRKGYGWGKGRCKDVGKWGEKDVGSEEKEGYGDGKRGRERHRDV